MIAVIVIVVLVVVIVGLAVLAFNGLVRRRNQVDNAWSQIDVQLKRRYDLIPNLVETVKGYAAHERGTFEAVTAARANAITAQQSGDAAKSAQADSVLTGALKSLFAGRGGLPGSQSEPELPRTPKRAERNRGSHCVGSPVLQRQCLVVQHEDSDVPVEHDRRDVSLHGAPVLLRTG